MKIKSKLKSIIILMLLLLCSSLISISAMADIISTDANKTEPQVSTIAADKTGGIIPVTFSKAGIYECTVSLTGFGSGAKSFYITEKDNREKFKMFRGFPGDTVTVNRIITAPVTYDFVIFEEGAPAGEKKISLSFVYHEPSAGRDVKAGETVNSYGLENLYYTVKLNKDSILTLEGDAYVCDSKKEPISNFEYGKDSNVIYLKKGSYFIGTQDGIHTFKYTTKKLKLPKNIKSKKATTMTLGKKYKIAFPASAKKETKVYNKLTLSAPKRISMFYKRGNMPEGAQLTFSIYKDKKHRIDGSTTDKNTDKVSFTGGLTSDLEDEIWEKKSFTLPAGTWYVQVGNVTGGDATVWIK